MHKCAVHVIIDEQFFIYFYFLCLLGFLDALSALFIRVGFAYVYGDNDIHFA
jgi:hypothetical protein